MGQQRMTIMDVAIGGRDDDYEVCGSQQNRLLLHDLPEDVLSLVSRSLQPRDVCNMSIACKKLNVLLSSDKIWWQQCIQVMEDTPDNLQAWRAALDSYKVLCRFLVGVKPLLGIWVHQNPELGNMVFVMWGFLSVVGCRIIPQELGASGFDSGLLWAPVFEIICNADGSHSFFLHGREKEKDFCYPGCFKPAEKGCNVLLLEVELRENTEDCQRLISDDGLDWFAAGSSRVSAGCSNAAGTSDHSFRKIVRSESERISYGCLPNNQGNHEAASFSRLGFGDRRRLLELVAHLIRLKIPSFANGPMFPTAQSSSLRFGNDMEMVEKDLLLLSERRSLLMHMQRQGDPSRRNWFLRSQTGLIPSDIVLNTLYRPHDCQHSVLFQDHGSVKGRNSNCLENGISNLKSCSRTSGKDRGPSTKKLNIAKVVKERMKQMIGIGTAHDGARVNSSSGDSRRLQLQDFLKRGYSVGLCLNPCRMKLSLYRSWPIMHDNRFALYKMPQQRPSFGREHAGLWGGTFGWPPGKPTEDKPGKALFFLLLSYEESEDGKILIATKILEGTHYVLHPNGSAMFIARIEEASMEKFPWDSDRDSNPIDVLQAYQGEGIANGYGFRYPGSKPGDLFVCSRGLLAFVWRESKAVLTLQRMNLQNLLRNGERVAALPPIANFAYLTKSYSNVFSGYSGLTSSMGTRL